MKELAALMDVSALATFRRLRTVKRPWTPKMREKVAWRCWERSPVRGRSTARGGVVTGESSFIRERARTLGMTMHDLADRVGVSYSYMTQVARGRQNMGVKVQARVESALHGSGEDRARQVRQPPGRRRGRGEQLHQGAGQGAGHEPAGPG